MPELQLPVSALRAIRRYVRCDYTDEVCAFGGAEDGKDTVDCRARPRMVDYTANSRSRGCG